MNRAKLVDYTVANAGNFVCLIKTLLDCLG